ncbi:hypothetical protein ACUT0J_001291 [Vibrio vulnificus]
MIEILPSYIKNPKTAFIFLGFVAFTIIFYAIDVDTYLFSEGVPNETTKSLIFLASIVLSYLVVEGLYRLKACIESSNKARKSEKEQNEKELAFKKEVETTLPHLKGYEISFLSKMSKGDASFDKTNKTAHYFRTNGYLAIVGSKSHTENIYRLNPIVRDCLRCYLNEQRQKALVTFCKSLTDEKKEALGVFFHEIVPFRECDDSLIKTFQSLNDMVAEGVIYMENFGSTSTFLLPEESETKLIQDGHFEKCYRNSVKLDLTKIPAPKSTGADARGGRR